MSDAAACVALTGSFNAQNATNALWACATLHLDDPRIVGPLARACESLTASFNAQDATISLWACARLRFDDPAVVGPLGRACVALAGSLDMRQALIAMWATQVLRGPEDHECCFATRFQELAEDRWLARHAAALAAAAAATRPG